MSEKENGPMLSDVEPKTAPVAAPVPQFAAPAVMVPTDQRTVAVVKDFETRADGTLALASFEDQKRFALQLMQQGMVSSTFKTPQAVILGIQYCKELGVPVQLGMKMLYVIDGKPSLFGDGPLALVQRSGQLESIEEFFLNEKQEKICVENKNLQDRVWAAVTRLKRRGDPLIQEDYFSLIDLEIAGMDMSKNGKKVVWAKYERIMMRYKSRSMSLKVKFSDMISGVNIAEYDSNFSPETPDVNASSSTLEREYGEETA